MLTTIESLTSELATTPRPDAGSSRQLYFALLEEEKVDAHGPAARAYLDDRLYSAAALESDLPSDIRTLASWIKDNTAAVGREYQHYLEARKAGAPRRFFSSKSHALYFLQCIAPTKLVDGAWLYGLVHHWNAPRVHSLIRIYLEELGDGEPDRNHVAIYKKLLATHGCDNWQDLSDSHYVQGAIQLALAHNAKRFLPELIGYNLGYEQLPLHLLISAYELDELGIDPYYFTLHITVDNADSGHAKQALQGVLDAQPRVGDREAFYRRVANGYQLNSLGEGAHSVVDGFDLEREVIAMLQKKSTIGKFVHSDYARIGGRTVTEWLSDPAHIPAFLDSLQERGWIKRHQPPRNSRFWRLIQGDQAQMYGVFSAYEQQLIYDWIAGDRASTGATAPGHSDTGSRAAVRRRHGMGLNRGRVPGDVEASDLDHDLRLLEQQVAARHSEREVMTLLAAHMSPARHHTAPGLLATRMFANRFDQ